MLNNLGIKYVLECIKREEGLDLFNGFGSISTSDCVMNYTEVSYNNKIF